MIVECVRDAERRFEEEDESNFGAELETMTKVHVSEREAWNLLSSVECSRR